MTIYRCQKGWTGRGQNDVLRANTEWSLRSTALSSVAEFMAGESRVPCCTGERSLGDGGDESGPNTICEPDDKRTKFPNKLVSPSCSSSKPLFWRPACSDSGVSQSPTDPSEANEDDKGPSEPRGEACGFRRFESDSSVKVRFVSETATFFMMAWRSRRGGLSRGAGDADMLPLARLSFTISATVKGLGSAGWSFAFSVTCVSYVPLACGPGAVLACATMKSSAQHQG